MNWGKMAYMKRIHEDYRGGMKYYRTGTRELVNINAVEKIEADTQPVRLNGIIEDRGVLLVCFISGNKAYYLGQIEDFSGIVEEDEEWEARA